MIPGFWPVNDKLYTPVTMKFISNHDPCAVKWHAPNKAPPWHSKSSGSSLQGGWYSRSSRRMCWWIQSNLLHHGMKIEEWIIRYRNPIVQSHVQKTNVQPHFLPVSLQLAGWQSRWIELTSGYHWNSVLSSGISLSRWVVTSSWNCWDLAKKHWGDPGRWTSQCFCLTSFIHQFSHRVCCLRPHLEVGSLSHHLRWWFWYPYRYHLCRVYLPTFTNIKQM